jgi:Tfp pilus assembly protein PilF
MKRQGSALWYLVGACVAVVLAAAPAFAQIGALQGRVIDEEGKPVAGAEVKLVYGGEQDFTFTVKTDNNGRWTRAGLRAVGGRWTITATKDGAAGFANNIEVPLNTSASVPDITIRKGAAAPGTPAENAARAKAIAEQKKILDDVNAALTASDFDTAITKLTEATQKIENCVLCFARLGDAYTKKKEPDFAKAEEAYKTATKMDANNIEAWEGLAILYNQQKKFTEAGEASAKVIELQKAGGGAGDATSAYNAGVIMSNQRKMPEAAEQFARAIQLDPKMADAHFQLAMAQMNLGKMPEALKSLEAYLAIAPTGSNAEMAKTLIPELKKMIK